jgi:hypothetical protein
MLVVRSCREIDEGLFHDGFESAVVEESLSPPSGPVVIGLEELIQISAAKREKPKLADRRIQVPGKRIAKFVPPIWRSRNPRIANGELQCSGDQLDQKELPERSHGRLDRLNRDTRRNRSEEKGGGQNPVDTGTDPEFYNQIWSSPSDISGSSRAVQAQVLVWVRKDLFRGRSFSQSVCFPVHVQDGDQADRVESVNLNGE